MTNIGNRRSFEAAAWEIKPDDVFWIAFRAASRAMLFTSESAKEPLPGSMDELRVLLSFRALGVAYVNATNFEIQIPPLKLPTARKLFWDVRDKSNIMRTSIDSAVHSVGATPRASVLLDKINKKSAFVKQAGISIESGKRAFRRFRESTYYNGYEEMDGFYLNLNNDLKNLKGFRRSPLWSRALTISDEFQRRFEGLSLWDERNWWFWVNWYKSIVDGVDFDQSFLRKVVSIEEVTWEAGLESVAIEVNKIHAKSDLERRIDELEAELRQATVNRHSIGGNMPPEALDEVPIAQELVVVFQCLEDLKNEIVKSDPDPTHLQKIKEALVHALKEGLAWSLKKGDLIVDTAIKWAVPAGGTGYLALNPEKFEAVIEAVRKLLNVL